MERAGAPDPACRAAGWGARDTRHDGQGDAACEARASPARPRPAASATASAGGRARGPARSCAGRTAGSSCQSAARSPHRSQAARAAVVVESRGGRPGATGGARSPTGSSYPAGLLTPKNESTEATSASACRPRRCGLRARARAAGTGAPIRRMPRAPRAALARQRLAVARPPLPFQNEAEMPSASSSWIAVSGVMAALPVAISLTVLSWPRDTPSELSLGHAALCESFDQDLAGRDDPVRRPGGVRASHGSSRSPRFGSR